MHPTTLWVRGQIRMPRAGSSCCNAFGVCDNPCACCRLIASSFCSDCSTGRSIAFIASARRLDHRSSISMMPKLGAKHPAYIRLLVMTATPENFCINAARKARVRNSPPNGARACRAIRHPSSPRTRYSAAIFRRSSKGRGRNDRHPTSHRCAACRPMSVWRIDAPWRRSKRFP